MPIYMGGTTVVALTVRHDLDISAKIILIKIELKIKRISRCIFMPVSSRELDGVYIRYITD